MDLFEYSEIIQKHDDGSYSCLPSTREKINHILHHGDGCLVVKGFPIEEKSRAELEKDVYDFSFIFGVPLSQTVLNEFIIRVEDLKGKTKNKAVKKGYTGNESLPSHNNEECDLMLLFGFVTAKEGGESRLASTNRICKQLQKEHPEEFLTLQEPLPYDKSIVSKRPDDWFYIPPISKISEDDYIIWYCRFFIHRAINIYPCERLSRKQLRALDALDKVIAENIQTYPIQVGDVLFLNNHKVLHARNEFIEGDDRLLYRTWLSIPNSHQLPDVYKNNYARVGKGQYRGGVWSENFELDEIPEDFNLARKKIQEHLYHSVEA